ncbi:valine--tRNA ligase [Theileria orientalis]|uniref:valine--tRNA ligase n=1 Tax=Theileria orientalis TaxID=68886 RepID=A0A976M766_THEOR|nr:valine--tRNA ligase [Theileria orientalis]
MVTYLFVLTHIAVLVTCVRTHGFIRINHTSNDVLSNELYKRNKYSNRIFSNPIDNRSFTNNTLSHQSTNADELEESHKVWYKDLLKYFKHDKNVDCYNKKGSAHHLNDKYAINIISPPPNVTGELHIGNLLNLVCSDVYRNYLILKGFKVNINFSNDHAGQSFQKLFDKTYHLNDQESHLSSISILSDGFIGETDVNQTFEKIKQAQSLCNSIKQRHIYDLKLLGIDWPYGQFSLNEDVQELSKKVFIEFYEKKLLSEQNWPSLANYHEDKIEPISAAEVDYKLLPKRQYTLKLFVSGSSNISESHSDFDLNGFEIIINTTAPEFYYATTGIGVSHEDYELMDFKKVYLPKINKVVPIVPLDTLSGDYKKVKETESMGTSKDYEGTVIGDYHQSCKRANNGDLNGNGEYRRQIRGVLITPAHSENDFWIGKRYDLELINILNTNGKLQNVPFKLLGCGLDEALADVMELFQENGMVDVSCPVNMFDRSTRVITLPILHYVLDSAKLADKALEAFEEIKVVPESRRSMILNRLRNIRNWCISRHGWWGTRLPIYFLYDDFKYYKIMGLTRAHAEKRAEELLNMTMDEIYSKGYRMIQDKRILDTWFTSSLWPILSHKTEHNQDKQHQRTVLFTCYDILETWIVKMLLMCSNINKESMFDEVYLHGMVSDGHGKKMSKSLNNTVVLSKLIRDLDVNVNKFDSSHFDTSDYAKCLNMGITDRLDLKKLDDVALLVKTNLIRLKLSSMCKCSDFTGNYDENDRSLYMLTKYYQIFKFYNKLLNTKPSGINTTVGNRRSVKYIESIILAKLNEYTSLIDNNIKTFQLSSSTLYLEHFIKTFSDYLVPFIRFTVTNHIHNLEHFDKYFVMLKSIMFPFVPTFVHSFLLNNLPIYSMEWPSPSESGGTGNNASDFDEFEKLLNELRRNIVNGTNGSYTDTTTDISVGLPSKLYSEFAISFINYLVELTFNKTPNISYTAV